MSLTPLIGTLLVPVAGGAIKLLFTYLSKRMETKKWQKTYEKAGASIPPPPPVPLFAPMPAPPLAQIDAEAHGARIKAMMLETELVEAQLALRKLRKALDECERELADKAAQIVVLREKSEALRQENLTLRKEGALNDSRNRDDLARGDQRGVPRRHADPALPGQPRNVRRREDR